MANQRPIVIVKRYRKGDVAHHGGAWKVAYADFVTAMMAFFLVMWLVTAVSKEQRAAIFDYFKNPSMEPGKSTKPAPGQMGPGGASTSPIDLGGGLDAPRTITPSRKPGIGAPPEPPAVLSEKQRIEAEAAALEKAQTELEKKQMESLMEDLKEAISKSQALEPFKDQLLLDITPEGLRIQIVDAQSRPMFDIGSSKLKGYTVDILREITPYLMSVPNRISLTGHTDTTPYRGITGNTNWDLSADRANAARRVLESAGLDSDRISRVVGLSSSVLFDRTNPRNPINRRISIVVLTKEAELDAIKTDIPAQVAENRPAVETPGGGDLTPAAAGIGPAAPNSVVDAMAKDAANGTLIADRGREAPPGGTVDPIGAPINPPMATAPAPVPKAGPRYPVGQQKKAP
jgi:chemotaxis protein MotB